MDESKQTPIPPPSSTVQAYRESYDLIAKQIDREDSLTNNRLTWTLTLNGFLFTALGFLGSQGVPDPKIAGLFYWVLPLTGIGVSLAGLAGVVGALLQIHYLTEEWEKLRDISKSQGWPRPFGDKDHSFWLGIAPCVIPILILLGVWMALLLEWQFPGEILRLARPVPRALPR